MSFPMPNLSENRMKRTSFRNVLWPFSRKSARRPLPVLRLNLLDTKIIERSCVRNYPGCSHKISAILRFAYKKAEVANGQKRRISVENPIL